MTKKIENKKATMGRPKGSSPRMTIVNFMLPESDKNRLIKQAKEKGVTLSEYIRSFFLEQK